MRPSRGPALLLLPSRGIKSLAPFCFLVRGFFIGKPHSRSFACEVALLCALLILFVVRLDRIVRCEITCANDFAHKVFRGSKHKRIEKKRLTGKAVKLFYCVITLSLGVARPFLTEDSKVLPYAAYTSNSTPSYYTIRLDRYGIIWQTCTLGKLKMSRKTSITSPTRNCSIWE